MAAPNKADAEAALTALGVLIDKCAKDNPEFWDSYAVKVRTQIAVLQAYVDAQA